MGILKLLLDQSGQAGAHFIGGFGTALSGALERAQDRARQREDMDLRKKMLDLQIKQHDVTNQLNQRKLEQDVRQQAALETLAQSFEGGPPQMPSPERAETELATPPQTGPTTPEGTRNAALVRAGLANLVVRPEQQVTHAPPGSAILRGGQIIGNVPERQVPEKPVALAPGGTLVNPRTGQPVFTAPGRPERPISVAPGGTLINPSTGQPIFRAPERPGAADVGPNVNFKQAKEQLESIAGKFKTSDLAKIKPELEGQANQLGYTITGVRPGTLFGFNVDIAPITKGARSAAQGGVFPTPSGGPTAKAPGTISKEQRLKNLGF